MEEGRHRDDVDLVIFGPENRPDGYVEPDDGMDRNQPTKLPKRTENCRTFLVMILDNKP